MGKTAHHLSEKWDTRPWPENYRMYWRGRPAIPVREQVVYDLRYSSAELRAASREGRRPQPAKKRHVACWWSYTQSATPSHIRTFWAHTNERKNRRYVKDELTKARRMKKERQARMFENAEKKQRRKLYDIW